MVEKTGMSKILVTNATWQSLVEMWRHTMHGRRKWRGYWRMEWVASTLHTTSKHGVSSITTADAHNSAASSRLNWWPRRFKWTRPFRRKTKSGFCACAITFQMQSITPKSVKILNSSITLASCSLKFSCWQFRLKLGTHLTWQPKKGTSTSDSKTRKIRPIHEPSTRHYTRHNTRWSTHCKRIRCCVCSARNNERWMKFKWWEYNTG
jgi:hypothetical protein